MKELDSSYITNLHDNLISLLHEGSAPGQGDTPFTKAVADNLLSNYSLWHLEDEARRTDVSDGDIARVKRDIDAENQRRNDFIETLDDIIIGMLPETSGDLPMNSETPGSVIDRLAIGGLKIYHMREQAERADASAEHLRRCNNKLEILIAQRSYLSAALDMLIKDLIAGRKRLKVYRQFKMYNDPETNPAVYKNESKG